MEHTKQILNLKERLLNRIKNIYAYLFGHKLLKSFNLFLVSIGYQALGINNPDRTYLKGDNILLTKLIKKIDTKKNLFLDIGANIGLITKIVLDNTENLNVMCFEPQPQNFKKLSEKYKNEKRCKIFNYAVGSKIENKIFFDWIKEGTGFASFYKDSVERSLRRIYGEVDRYSTKVDVITLDSIQYENKIEFIKIDVEGHEFEVLKGARKSIDTHKPQYILLEFNEYNVESKVFLKDLIDFLYNYKIFRVIPGGNILELNNPYNPFTHEVFASQMILFIKNKN